MHRVGAAPATRWPWPRVVDRPPELDLEAVWTHCAVADEPGDPFTGEQLARFDGPWPRVEAAGIDRARCATPPTRPAPSPIPAPASTWSAAASPSTASHPSPGAGRRVPTCGRRCARARGVAREGGRRRARASPTGCATARARPPTVATVPARLRRRRAAGGSAAVGGEVLDRRPPPPDRRHRHDGPAHGRLRRRRPSAVGDEVVLLGRQGDDEITAEEWADRLGTIAYEIICGLGPRLLDHESSFPRASAARPSRLRRASRSRSATAPSIS